MIRQGASPAPKMREAQDSKIRGAYPGPVKEAGTASLVVPKVLIVEHEAPLNALLRHDLEEAGYWVETLEHGEELALRVQQDRPDVLVLNWTASAAAGTDLCQQLRTHPRTARLPIMVLASSCERVGCVAALSVGADDCLTMPFFPPELVARLHALLRRARPEVLTGLLCAKGVALDRVRQSVQRDGQELKIGPLELRLLEFLMASPGQVFSREQLLANVWPDMELIDDRTVDVYIGRLRKTLSAVPGPELIRTVRGAGYSFG